MVQKQQHLKREFMWRRREATLKTFVENNHESWKWCNFNFWQEWSNQQPSITTGLWTAYVEVEVTGPNVIYIRFIRWRSSKSY
jgi:hypothetical protein